MLVNCVIYNDGAHKDISDKEHRADRTIILRHGEKMIFGKDGNKGLVLENGKLKVVTIGENGITEDDILVHDAHTKEIGIHSQLVDMKFPDFPVALGVIRDVEDMTYDDNVRDQLLEVKANAKINCVDDLLRSGSTWEVE
jgi:2-oxoglutarate ferredoxin oxidoreductase subunit beta